MENETGSSPKPNLFSEFQSTFDFNRYVTRVQEIVSDPLGTWPKVKAEPGDVKQIYLQWVVVTALLPVICTFVGLSVLGSVPILDGLKTFLWQLILSMGGMYVFSLIVVKLAPSFGGSATIEDAMKWLVTAMMPGAVVSILTIIPLSFLSFIVFLLMLGAFCYGLYILWLGVPIMLGIPDDRRVPFFISTVACIFVAAALASWLAGHAGLA